MTSSCRTIIGVTSCHDVCMISPHLVRHLGTPTARVGRCDPCITFLELLFGCLFSPNHWGFVIPMCTLSACKVSSLAASRFDSSSAVSTTRCVTSTQLNGHSFLKHRTHVLIFLRCCPKAVSATDCFLSVLLNTPPQRVSDPMLHW